MSLDSWTNALEAHRPLGSLQRSRRRSAGQSPRPRGIRLTAFAAYEASRKFREAKNATPIEAVTSIDQIPD
jgi:hypothetical protein